jgi:tetratricopeptide (TPR) repeat protein
MEKASQHHGSLFKRVAQGVARVEEVKSESQRQSWERDASASFQQRNIIRVPLPGRSPVAMFAAVALLSAGLLVTAAIRTAGGATFGTSMTLPSLFKAAALWPGNPEFHYRLSILLFNSPRDEDRSAAIAQAREATRLGPLWARYWGQLAWACEAAGDSKCADDAIERVRRLAPMDPQAVALIANYYLISDRRELALEQFQHLVQISPTHDWDVFRICQSAGYPTALVSRLALQAGPQVSLDYISYLSGRGDIASARDLWKGLIQGATHGGFSFPVAWVDPYLDRLLDLGLGQEVRNVRADLEKLKGVSAESSDRENILVNGGFEEPPSDSGLNWHQPDTAYAVVDLAETDAHRGSHCMRVDFTVGRNDQYLLAYQRVPLEPNSRYHLTTSVRSDGITSDSGPQVHIYDPGCRACLDVRTESTTGSTPWHEVQLEFSTGPRTQVARLDVVREPAKNYPMDITGTFWLDDVFLKLEATNPTARSER